MMKNIFRISSKIFMTVYLFLIIYYPPIININILHVTAAIAYFYIINNENNVLFILKMSRHVYLIFAFVLTGIYLGVVSLLNMGKMDGTIAIIQYVLEIIPCCLMTVVFLKKNKYNLDDFMDMLLWGGVMQGLLAFAAIMSPDFQKFLVDKAINYGFDYSKLSSFLGRRYYGFAYNLVTYTPLVQVSLFVYAFHKFIMGRWRYLTAVPLLLFSSIINARSPIIFIVIGLILFITMGEKKMRSIVGIVALICLFFVSLYVLMMMDIIPYYTILWLLYGAEEMNLVMESDTSSPYVSWIKNIDDYTPVGLNFLFGKGQLVIGQIDMGYVNYLWLGGVMFLVLINLIFLKIELTNILYAKGNDSVRIFSIHMLVTTIVFNFKMPIYLLNEYSIMILLVYFVILSDRIEKNKV